MKFEHAQLIIREFAALEAAELNISQVVYWEELKALLQVHFGHLTLISLSNMGRVIRSLYLQDINTPENADEQYYHHTPHLKITFCPCGRCFSATREVDGESTLVRGLSC